MFKEQPGLLLVSKRDCFSKSLQTAPLLQVFLLVLSLDDFIARLALHAVPVALDHVRSYFRSFDLLFAVLARLNLLLVGDHVLAMLSVPCINPVSVDFFILLDSAKNLRCLRSLSEGSLAF